MRNRFRGEEVGRAAIQWSFRGATQLNMSLWSPEVVLATDEELRMKSDYEATA
jgi:hypothetical protein